MVFVWEMLCGLLALTRHVLRGSLESFQRLPPKLLQSTCHVWGCGLARCHLQRAPVNENYLEVKIHCSPEAVHRDIGG